jgi:hypothetical protein
MNEEGNCKIFPNVLVHPDITKTNTKIIIVGNVREVFEMPNYALSVVTLKSRFFSSATK